MSFVWLLCLCGTAPQKSLQMYRIISVIPNLFSCLMKKVKPCNGGYCKADTFIQGQRLLECKCGSEVGLGEMVNLSVVKILIGSAANVICALIA